MGTCGDGGRRTDNALNTVEPCALNLYTVLGLVTSTLPMIETSAPLEDPVKRSSVTGVTSPSPGLFRTVWDTKTNKERKVSTACGQVDWETKFLLHQDPPGLVDTPQAMTYSGISQRVSPPPANSSIRSSCICPHPPQLTTATVSSVLDSGHSLSC